MRGPHFPLDATSNSELAHDHGTPTSTADDIPIDPALTGAPAIDPALMAEEQIMKVESFQAQHVPQDPTFPIQMQESTPYEQDDAVRQYSQVPQGDPFAPQVIAPYNIPEPPQPLPTTKSKRRRKQPRREEQCGYCYGNEHKNKRSNEPESMVTCTECGRSGHPSCMELANIGDVIRTYPWRCLECKICEVCSQKGDDEKILFCDCCDRGWHMYCFTPPMVETPPGKWTCPQCPPIYGPQPMPVFADGGIPPPPFDPATPQVTESPFPAPRQPSVASTSNSQSVLQEPEEPEAPAKPKRGHKKRGATGRGPGRPKKPKAPTPAVQEESDTMEVDEEPVTVPKSLPRSARASKRTRIPTRESSEEAEEHLVTPVRQREVRKRQREPSPTASLPRVRLRVPPLPSKGKGKEREEDEEEDGSIPGVFDDILSVEDRNIAKTTILRTDKALFERARITAEEKLVPSPIVTLPPTLTARLSTLEVPEFSTPGPSRPLRSTALHHISTSFAAAGTPNSHAAAALSASPVPSTPGAPHKHQQLPATLRIRTIRFGEYDIKTWYDAPFPEEYANIPDGRLWICEFCLKYMKSRFVALRHRVKCKARNPPGDEIYRDGHISIFEVDGRRNKIYCQNLCLLSKMFLDHKSLFYDVEPFLFYVITEVDEVGARFVGYFSKEKRSPKDYNLSCIMTLPVRQRQGWGNLLIDFSYLLSKKERRLGSPEKPLSSLGQIGYRKYWTLAVMRYLEHAPDKIRLEDVAAGTAMILEDICQTLMDQNMIFPRDASPPIIKPSPGQSIKYPKGRRNGAARRQFQRMNTQDRESDSGNIVIPKHYDIRFDRAKVAAFLRNYESKGQLKLKPEKLQWTPYLLSRKNREPLQSLITETPALAATSTSSMVNGDQYAASSIGEVPSENSESSSTQEAAVAFGLFSSPPPTEDAADEELPTPRAGRGRRRSTKKSTPKIKTDPSEDIPVEFLTPSPAGRRTRQRANGASPETMVNGSQSIPDSEGSQRKKRGPPIKTRAEEMHEDATQSARKLRSGRNNGKVDNRELEDLDEEVAVPVSTSRKRRRVESPEEEEEEAEMEQTTSDNLPVPTTNGRHINGLDGESSEIAESEHTEAERADVDQAVSALQSSVAEAVGEEESRLGKCSGDGGEVYMEESDKYGSRTVVLQAESDLRSTLVIPEEEYGDEDAEGEDDAEGEEETESGFWILE